MKNPKHELDFESAQPQDCSRCQTLLLDAPSPASQESQESPDSQESFETREHLGSCAECRQFADELASLGQRFRDAPVELPSDSAFSAMTTSIMRDVDPPLDARPAKVDAGAWERLLSWLGEAFSVRVVALALAALLLAVGLWSLRTNESDPQTQATTAKGAEVGQVSNEGEDDAVEAALAELTWTVEDSSVVLSEEEGELEWDLDDDELVALEMLLEEDSPY